LADASPQPDSAATCVIVHRTVMTNTPVAMATDATHLYWFDNASGPAAVHATDKCTPSTTRDLATAPGSGTGLAGDGQNLYLSTFSATTTGGPGAIYAIAKSPRDHQKRVDASQRHSGVEVGGG
jgi:hypothetical protein